MDLCLTCTFWGQACAACVACGPSSWDSRSSFSEGKLINRGLSGASGALSVALTEICPEVHGNKRVYRVLLSPNGLRLG